MTGCTDDVFSIVLQQDRSSNANTITDNQLLLCHKHKLLMPSDDLDKVSTCPAGKFTLRRLRGQARCQLACWHSLVRARCPGNPH